MIYAILWDEVLGIYNQTSRYQTLKRHGNATFFLLCLLIYLDVCVYALLISYSYFPISVFMISISGILMNFFLHRRIRNYSTLTLKNLSYASQERAFRYFEFKRFYNSSAFLEIGQIDRILEWTELWASKYQIRNYIAHKYVLSFITLISVIIASYNQVKEYAPLVIVVLIIAFAFSISISLLLQDFLSGPKRKQFEICQFLRCLKLEQTKRGD